MIKWVNFLHIYQPPYQEPEIIQKIVRQSYWPLVNILKEHQDAKITLNFSGCLLEHLFNIGEEKLIEEFKNLIAGKKIEIVGSARYHPILPLLPAKEIERQIILNDQILRQAFDEHYKPEGFFLPEMAYSTKVAKIIKKLGYKWIIIDEIAYKGKLGLVDYNRKYKMKGTGLYVIFRNREISKTFVPQTILELATKSNPPNFLISATDGEMYGHHHKDGRSVFSEALKNKNIQTITISEYLKQLPNKSEVINPLSSSWETTLKDLQRKVPYSLWKDPNNKIHQYLWQLRKLAIQLISKTKEQGINYDWARHHLDRGLSSCAWWWAADKKLDVFDFITWNPDTIEKGIKELISSIRSLKTVSQKTKLDAEKYYHLLIKEIWKKHWKKYHKFQAAENKMAPEIKMGLLLLNQDFLIKLFQKKLPKDLIDDNKIDYIAIKTYKRKLGVKSFYHIVSRYTLHFSNKKAKPITIFCNANSRESRQGAFLAMEHIWASAFQKGELQAPRPIFYNKKFKAMFYVEGRGKNLYRYIIEKETSFEELQKIVNLTGRWLARLHAMPSKGVKNFNSVQSKVATVLPGPKNFLENIKQKHLEYPKYHQQTKELFDRINGLEKELTHGEPKSIIHGDFHPENVVYEKEKKVLTVIDYTDCCLANFTRDLGNFYQQLGYMSKNHLSQAQIETLQKIFLDSYLAARKINLSEKDQQLFEVYKAWTALRSAIYFLTISAFDRPRADLLFEEARSYLKKIKLS